MSLTRFDVSHVHLVHDSAYMYLMCFALFQEPFLSPTQSCCSSVGSPFSSLSCLSDSLHQRDLLVYGRSTPCSTVSNHTCRR